ncbi:MAG TPA: hypothetical protein VGL34_28555 [Steroidobacteraceae bacterium]|jgi:hypothetical protein
MTENTDKSLPAVTPVALAAFRAALQPIVHAALETQRLTAPANYQRFMELARAGELRLHVSTILSSEPAVVAVSAVDANSGEVTVLVTVGLVGGVLLVKPEGASFN